MFQIEDRGRSATFRLQLFTSTTGLRPVAVATQDMSELGMSLVNHCEIIAGQVWHEYFPDEPLPPIWVQSMPAIDFAANDVRLVSFDVGPDRTLSAPKWSPITRQQLNQFVGSPVETDRGSGFVAPPPPPTTRTRYELVPMDQMPRGRPSRQACMTGAPPPPSPWWRRQINIIRGEQEAGGRNCCWYHGGDWAAVTDTAVRLIAAVEATAGTDNELRDKVLTAARAEGLSKWALIALNTLLIDPISINEATDEHPASFVNGQHRTRAMRDAGLSAVLVGVIEEVELKPEG
jgi:hypothetical protein